MGSFKLALVIAVFVGYVSAKGYSSGTQPGARSGGKMQPNIGGGIPGQSKIGGGFPSNLGGQLPSNRGSGVPSQAGNNYGPIGQKPIDVGSPIGGPSDIGSRVPSNIGGRVPSNIGGRPEYGSTERQAANKEETYPPRPFNIDYNIVDEEGNMQFRREEGDGVGNVRGTYGYRNTQGLYRTVEYVSNKDGFKASVDTNEPGTDGKENPADVIMNVEQTPSGIQDQYNSGGNRNQRQNNYQGGQGTQVNLGGGSGVGAGKIGSTGDPGGRRGPMSEMNPNKGSPILPAGVNTGVYITQGRQTNQYNSGVGAGPSTGRLVNIGGPRDRRGPMSGMKPNKGYPDLPAGVNPGGKNGAQNYAQQSKMNIY